VLKVSARLVDGVGMANTGKHIAPSRIPAGLAAAGEPSAARLSPRVEMLRKLVAAGQYQVSPRYLAYKIFRAAGVRPE
jgi:hypothetical protein